MGGQCGMGRLGRRGHPGWDVAEGKSSSSLRFLTSDSD